MADETRDQLPPQLQIVYKDAIDNAMFLKKQQFGIANYGAALLAALVAFSQFLAGRSAGLLCAEKIVLSMVVVVVVTFGAIGLVFASQGALGKFRDRLSWFANSEYFSPNERRELVMPVDKKSFWHDWPFLSSLIAVLVGGGALSLLTVALS